MAGMPVGSVGVMGVGSRSAGVSTVWHWSQCRGRSSSDPRLDRGRLPAHELPRVGLSS
jgi:hypothetical protein